MTEAAAGGALLEVEGVVKRFGGIHAVDGAGFEVAEGSITALIGPNGAGKTTLFNVVTGFQRGDRGSVRFAGEEILRPPRPRDRPPRHGAHLPDHQGAGGDAGDRQHDARRARPAGRAVAQPLPPPAGGARAASARSAPRRCELLEVFDLAGYADAYAGTLSGGQRKLLELARALMARPRLLLLDEPMAGINPTLGRRLLDHMQTLRSERGMTFLFVEHDMEVVMNHSDRGRGDGRGQGDRAGEPHAVREDPAVVDAYLGGAA